MQYPFEVRDYVVDAYNIYMYVHTCTFPCLEDGFSQATTTMLYDDKVCTCVSVLYTFCIDKYHYTLTTQSTAFWETGVTLRSIFDNFKLNCQVTTLQLFNEVLYIQSSTMQE